MFPEVERDNPRDIIDWVLRRDLAKPRRVPLADGTEIVYVLDSRFCILTLANRAIGFAFITYDCTNKIVYGNYMAVQECWRSGGIARALARSVEQVCRKLFPKYMGTVFEVEILDESNLERIIAGLEYRKDKTFESDEDRNVIRRFLRINIYQHLGCKFFMRRDSKRPGVCRSPCLDVGVPKEQWESLEEDYWLMWYNRDDAPVNPDQFGEAWTRAVKCIRLEILAKSIIETSPVVAGAYWQYANTIVTRTLRETGAEEVYLGNFLDRHHWDLFRRWCELEIPLGI